MSNYRRGLRAEHAIRDVLRNQGYDVIRSAGSRGHWDLVAIRPNSPVRLIQVKTNTSALRASYAVLATKYTLPLFAVEVWRRRPRRGWHVTTWLEDGQPVTMEY